MIDQDSLLLSTVDEPFKTRVAMFIERHNLTIKHHVIERTDCLSNDRKALREVVLVPRIQPKS